MDSIGVRQGMRVGEAGAGQGYFTFPLARRVGSGGMVFSNDISGESLDVIRERAVREGLKNIRTVVGEVEDPLFPEKNLDLVRGLPNSDQGDLFISFMLTDGNWTDPVTMGTSINTNQMERFSTVSSDGKYLFFTRDTPGYDEDVYWVSAKIIDDLKKESIKQAK
jgi:SAM-dependent methyltransferase